MLALSALSCFLSFSFLLSPFFSFRSPCEDKRGQVVGKIFIPRNTVVIARTEIWWTRKTIYKILINTHTHGKPARKWTRIIYHYLHLCNLVRTRFLKSIARTWLGGELNFFMSGGLNGAWHFSEITLYDGAVMEPARERKKFYVAYLVPVCCGNEIVQLLKVVLRQYVHICMHAHKLTER